MESFAEWDTTSKFVKGQDDLSTLHDDFSLFSPVRTAGNKTKIKTSIVYTIPLTDSGVVNYRASFFEYLIPI